MSLLRFALNPAKVAALAGAVFFALAIPVLSTAPSIADTGSSSENPSPAGVDDHLWDK
ncbi:MAG TPA: hypothetical protein VGR06_16990 [Actinophytocola sp.]|uniref:hypothetical protein n=1 Tax=Actinophytocola sp. TaxID=1872138 RepID=UPI002E0AE7F2|nr:hypothetical protein [Actinophytocola sp.]